MCDDRKHRRAGRGSARAERACQQPWYLTRSACRDEITTVAQNYNEIGRIAMELLLRKLGERTDDPVSDAPEQVLLNAEIILRQSA